MEEKKKEKDRLEKHNAELIGENKRLVEPLQKARSELDEMRRQMANYDKDKQLLAVSQFPIGRIFIHIALTHLQHPSLV